MRAIELPSARIDRFDQCGSNAWVMRSSGPNPRYAIRCSRCRDRLCPTCTAERSNVVARNIAKLVELGATRLITLTLRSVDVPLSQQCNRLWSCWTKLRRRKGLAQALRGGIAFIETTRNKQTGMWHPHLHVIYVGEFIALAGLRSAWLKITGDSWIVDIRRIANATHAVRYVAKYAGKGVSNHVLTNPALLSEVVDSMTGRRTYATFGTWRNHDFRHIEPVQGGWKVIGRLSTIEHRAAQGDAIAKSILLKLAGEIVHEHPESQDPYSDADALPMLYEPSG